MDNFSPNLHIIYTDETNNFTYKSCKSYSMSSIVVPYGYYKQIEKDWNKLKEKYDVDEGVCLHFTDIKALLNPAYFSRTNNRNFNMEKIFCNNNKLNVSKLYNFYIDILNFIKNHEFKIITTNLNELSKDKFDNFISKKHINSNWYILFKDHLNDLTEYALRENYEITPSKRNNKPKNYKLQFKAKIRYDGDLGLSNKDDIRDAFSHSITSGTNKFNSSTIRNCFEELRFINKIEVGYCFKCPSLPSCSNKNYSHAGNEIIDFITMYAGKYLTKDANLKYLKEDVPDSKPEESFKKSTTIFINNTILKPLENIKPKIYKR